MITHRLIGHLPGAAFNRVTGPADALPMILNGKIAGQMQGLLRWAMTGPADMIDPQWLAFGLCCQVTHMQFRAGYHPTL